MKIAIPTENGKLSSHFGHSESFEIYEVDLKTKSILFNSTIPSPPHQPGLLPKWLSDMDVDMIIASGIGSKAQDLFRQINIEVIFGAPCIAANLLINSFMNDTLSSKSNKCSHQT